MTSGPPESPARDRRQLLLAPGAVLNGIDYVDVAPGRTRLLVHFLNTVTVRGSLSGSQPVTITGGEVVTGISARPVDERADWSADRQGRPVLAVTVSAAGDLSIYRLAIASRKLDPFFGQVLFRFTASGTGGAGPARGGPEPDRPQVPIDYLAKDYGSFTQALSEFSAQRYPAWVERSEADIGIMLMEALAATADELSYYQDRVLAESTIMTATQRMSVVGHARLVDYEPAPATVATAILQLDVSGPANGDPGATGWTIDTASPPLIQAQSAAGSVVSFEIEDPAAGLPGAAAAPAWAAVDARWNRAGLRPYYWDDSQRLLAAGSTKLYLVGHGLGLYPGQRLLLDSDAPGGAGPPVRELVTVAAADETADPLIGSPPPTVLTRVVLRAPTARDHDLTATAVAGNLVPAVQGLRRSEAFTIPQPGAAPGPVVVRAAANSTPQDPRPAFRYCLSTRPLAWIAAAAPADSLPARPEIILSHQIPAGGSPSPWAFQHWLLEAGPADQVFTLTAEQYSPVLTSDGTTWFDYDGDGGTTIRFGDGTFGMLPLPGTAFTVTYRVGGGSAGNVPADSIVNVAAQGQGALIAACTNPFPAAGGAAAESGQQVRDRAPQDFRARQLRAVLASDYTAAAQSLAWVRQASTAFRWTGSWLTVLTHADPAGAQQPTLAQLEALTGLLGRRRLAGYESYGMLPAYASIDLLITISAQPGHRAEDVAAAVVAGLQPGRGLGGAAGFFDHSRWNFGAALESSALLAAIQSCPGVAGVERIRYRQPGRPLADWVPLPAKVQFSPGEILRVDNDPARPQAGLLQVEIRGAG